MAEVCMNHADHAAIEHCEVCGQPLCGLCLWYAADGRRLCGKDAALLADAGISITPPETYAEAIPASLSRPTPPLTSTDLPYRGNSFDLASLLAAVLGAITLGSCLGLAYCLPFAAGLLGLYAYLNAPQSADPRRTRTLAGIGLAVAILMLLFLALALFIMLFAFGMAIITSGP